MTERDEHAGRVTLVGAGPGDPDLITVRGRRALEEADVVLYDRLVHPDHLDGLDAELVYVGKSKNHASISQEQINEWMARFAGEGKSVVRLKGGDPTVFGRGSEEVLYLRERDVDCEVVPGISSATAAPTRAGVPVTHRGLADAFTVVTAHSAVGEDDPSIPPFHPERTLVVMMGVGTMERWRDALLDSGYPPEWPVAFVERASWENERSIVTTLEECVTAAREDDIEPPTTAVIGRVVAVRSTLETLSHDIDELEDCEIELQELSAPEDEGDEETTLGTDVPPAEGESP